MDGRPRGSALRRGRVSEPNRVYLVTTVTCHRTPVFNDFWAARIVVEALRFEEQAGRASTLAFVVMPDHLHWLLSLGSKRALSQVVRGVKAVVSRRIGESVWQRGFHDHALRSDEDLPAMARYIVANPLRAGLVVRIADYPHWDAIWL